MNFQDLTIKQVKELTDQFKRINPDFKTPGELLEEMGR